MTADDHFFENEIGLVEIEDEVQLANIAEVLVEHFYKMVNNVKHNQLIVLLFNARHEVQWGVTFEHNFVFFPLQEVRQFARPTNDHCPDLYKRPKVKNKRNEITRGYTACSQLKLN